MTDGRISRRTLLLTAGALGALAATPWPLRVRDAAAQASQPGLSEPALATYVAAVEAICSFDGNGPPPVRVGSASQPDAAQVGQRFDAEFRAQLPAFRDGVDLVLTLTEQAPRTPPPLGAVTPDDLAAYQARGFSELDIPLRLRLVRSWQFDHNRVPLDPPIADLTGMSDFGTLHRAVAQLLTQLTTLYYYSDARTWPLVGWTGPWLGRSHEGEDLPFSHHGHEAYPVDYGNAVVA
jgi:hypothetical protein